MRTRVSHKCTLSRTDTSKSLSVPEVRWRLSTQITWVMLFTNNRRYFVFVLFDADVAAASQRGIHVLVVLGVRRHQVQQSLQQSAHPLLCWPQILHQGVLKHAVDICCFQVNEQEPKRALGHVLEHLFDLFGRVSAADLFQYGFSFESV